ncbi:MAG TPA: SGNH hydrolase domain-containing protein, partial [Acidimicrobiales bacterium]|nr:SGNH hydrolase domain-containing protein [Acidimicrobiales bacterium]
SLSYQLLEHPIRVSSILDRHRRTVIAVGLATSVIAAIIIIPAITNPATSTAAVAGQDLTTTGFTPVPTGLDWEAIKADFPKLTNCYGKPATDCTLVHGTGPHILLIGDSHAGMMIPALTALANTENLTLSVSTDVSCPWQRGLYATPHAVFDKTTSIDECKTIKNDTYDRVIPELQPDIIVTMNFPYEVRSELVPYLGPDLKVPAPGSSNDFGWQQKATTDSLSELRAGGRKVILIEPTPMKPKFDPLACLSRAKVLQECRYVAATEPTALEDLYRQLDKQDDDVWSLDLDHLVCPYFPICDPIVDHQVTKLDVTHFTRSFVRTLGPSIDAYFKQNGIIST